MDNQLDILAQLKRNGVNPADPVPEGDYHRARMQIRTFEEKVRDGAAKIDSRIRTSELNPFSRTVSLEQAAANEAKCREQPGCGRFRELTPRRGDRKLPACDACNCTSRDLESKWKDPEGRCPLGLWSNDE